MDNKLLRVLRVADVPNNRTGGISRAMYLTGDYMEAWGHTVEYLWAGDMPPVRAQLRRFVTPLHIRKIVRERTRAGRGWDVIEVHEPSAAWVCHDRRTDRRMPPVVAYSHGIESRHHSAELTYRRKVGLPISLKHRYSPLSIVLQAEYALHWAAHRLVTNADDRAYIVNKWNAADDTVSIIPTGIVPSYCEAGDALVNTGWSDDRYKKVLFIASWILRKGIRDLAPAMNRVLANHEEAMFTIAGCGVSEDVVRKCFDDGIQARLTVLSRVEGEVALQALYAKHGIFLLPSYFEGQPLVMVEAGALYNALVMTDVCGMKDFLAGGANGIAVPVGDSAAIYAAIVRLMGAPNEARALGIAANRKAREQTWEQTARIKTNAYRYALNT